MKAKIFLTAMLWFFAVMMFEVGSLLLSPPISSDVGVQQVENSDAAITTLRAYELGRFYLSVAVGLVTLLIFMLIWRKEIGKLFRKEKPIEQKEQQSDQ